MDKTNFILFRSRRKAPPGDNLDLLINNTPIEQVESAKFLGVHIDQHLTWTVHINHISAKIAKNVGILTRIAYLLPKTTRLNLYYALIYPYLTYCNMIWSATYKTRLSKLITLQKRAIRLIAGIRKLEHSRPYFLELKLLTLHQIRDFQIGEFFYRLDQGLLPPIFRGFIHHVSDIHTYSTRNSSDYRPVSAHCNTRRFTVKSYGTQVWNSIPSVIRLSRNLSAFKKSFRALLISGTL